MSTVQIMQLLGEHAWLALLIPVAIFVSLVARAAAGIVCAAATCRWIRANSDLREDERRKLITASIWRYLRLRVPP